MVKKHEPLDVLIVGEHRADLVAFEVFHGGDSCSFGRDGEETLAEFQTLGMACGEKACEGVDGCESSIARRGLVSTLGLQIIEEGKQIIGAKMPDIQFDDLAVVSCGEKT